MGLRHTRSFVSLQVYQTAKVVKVAFVVFFFFFLRITSRPSALRLEQVPEVISRIRQVSKSAFKEDAKSKQDADEAFYNSQKFEVLYCGKVETSARQPSLSSLFILAEI